MRKKFILLLILIIGIFFSGCSTKAQENPDTFSLKKGLEMTQLMNHIAESKEYLQMFSLSESLNTITESIASNNFDSPESAIIIKVPKDMQISLLKTLQQFSNINLPEDEIILQQIEKRAAKSVPSFLNGSYGAEWLAVSSILSVDEVYERPKEMTELTYVIFQYKDTKIGSLIAFLGGEEKFLQANASLIKLDHFPEDIFSKEGIQNYLDSLLSLQDTNFNQLEITHFDKEELNKILK